MFIFSKKNGNSQLETYLFFNSNFVFFKFRSDLLIYYFKQTPLSPLNVYHLLVLNPSKEIAPAYISRSSLCSFYQKMQNTIPSCILRAPIVKNRKKILWNSQLSWMKKKSTRMRFGWGRKESTPMFLVIWSRSMNPGNSSSLSYPHYDLNPMIQLQGLGSSEPSPIQTFITSKTKKEEAKC